VKHMLETVQKFFDKLPEYERDLPLFILDSTAYTPRATLDEVKRGTATGKRLQILVEQKRLGTLATDEKTLAKLRLRTLLATKPDKPLFATLGLPSKVYRPRELAAEIQAESAVGRQWIEAEKEQMKMLISL